MESFRLAKYGGIIMSPAGERNDPIQSFRFRLELESSLFFAIYVNPIEILRRREMSAKHF